MLNSKKLRKLKKLKTIVFSLPFGNFWALTYVFNFLNFFNFFNFPFLRKLRILYNMNILNITI